MPDIPRLTAIVGVAAVVGVGGIFALPGGTTDEPGGVDISSGDHRLNIVANAVPKPGFDVMIPGYRDTEEGADTGFAQSYGASGDQSRKVARRVPADIVNFSVEPDITRLVKEGIVDEDWKDNVPGDESGASVPFGSVVSFVTREGNPKELETWDDLLEPGIQVISPNPASSGSAKWNLLAPYSAWFYTALDAQPEGKRDYVAAHEEALNKVSLLVGEHFNVRPKSGREATSTFEQGQGDVLLSYENEAILLDRTDSSIDCLNPPQTFRIDNPVAVVNTTDAPEQAYAFRDYLFTEDAEKLWPRRVSAPAVTSSMSPGRPRSSTLSRRRSENPSPATRTSIRSTISPTLSPPSHSRARSSPPRTACLTTTATPRPAGPSSTHCSSPGRTPAAEIRTAPLPRSTSRCRRQR